MICITSNGPTSVRFRASSNIIWTKSSFIKGPIEKGALDGNKSHFNMMNDLIIEKINGKSAAKRKKRKQAKKTKEQTKVKKVSFDAFLNYMQPTLTAIYEYMNLSRLIMMILLIFNVFFLFQLLFSTPESSVVEQELVKIRELLEIALNK